MAHQTKRPLAGADAQDGLVFGRPAQRSLWLRLLERLALAVEKAVNLLTGSPQLNPFYHTGPIAVFLLVIVGLSGLYLFFVFQYGFEASYRSVAQIEGNLLARVIRAIHRYASDAAIIVSLIHAFRIFFMGRFRGPRWLAWVSGVGMVILLWLCGVSGYWLVWDQRAQLITTSLTDLLRQYTPFGTPLALWLLSAEESGQSWILMFGLLSVHIATAVAVGAFFIWLHIRRLNRPRYLLARHWLIGLGLGLVLVAAAFPVGMLPQADPALLPGPMTLDPIFLFFLPTGLSGYLGWLVVLLVVALALPWLSLRRQHPRRAVIDRTHCTGCARCAEDCPYRAITMLECAEGGPHKLVAVGNPNLCVSCGVCVGACAQDAISLGGLSTASLWQTVLARLQRAGEEAMIVFTCERHAAQGARPYLNQSTVIEDGGGRWVVEVIPLPCVAALPPSLLTRTLEAGAAEVRVVGCPPGDCAQREGDLRMRERLDRLKLSDAPLTTAWLPPDAFSRALRATAGGERTAPASPNLAHPSWRHFVPAFVLLTILFALQVWLTRMPYTPYADDEALIHITGRHRGAPARLVLKVDGHVLLDQVYQTGSRDADRVVPVFEQVKLSPGEHHLRLSLADSDQETRMLFDATVNLESRQVWELTWEE